MQKTRSQVLSFAISRQITQAVPAHGRSSRSRSSKYCREFPKAFRRQRREPTFAFRPAAWSRGRSITQNRNPRRQVISDLPARVCALRLEPPARPKRGQQLISHNQLTTKRLLSWVRIVDTNVYFGTRRARLIRCRGSSAPRRNN
jgi:hypothetical protein